MNQQYNTIFTLAGLIFLTYSCQQVNDDVPEQFEAEVEDVVNILAYNLLTVNIIGGDGEQPFSSGRFLGGEDSFLSSTSRTEERDPMPMITCIRSLNLELDQLQDIRRLLFVFENCKSNIIIAYREEIRKLIGSLEGRRLELLDQLRSGAISREEHKIQIDALRDRYRFAFDELRESYKEELIPCLKGFVSRLQMTVEREDWLRFRKCVSEM